MKEYYPRPLLFAVSCLLLSGMPNALAQGDDFNDGDAAGWTEVTPLSGFGVSSTFTFPDGNSYRMMSAPSPDEPQLGPSRMGAVRADATYTDFYQFVDVVGYDQLLIQNIGMLARVSDVGLGTLDGYGVTYNPAQQKMFFTVITDEQGNNLDDVDVPVNPGDPVRMVFQGSGSTFTFEIFALPDLATPVASIVVSDPTYASGISGLFVVTDEADTALSVDCTFDNYFAAEQKPTRFEIIGMQIVGDKLAFDFFSEPGQRYAIWRSVDLILWEEETDSIVGANAPQTRTEIQRPAVAQQYYQIRLQE